MAGRINSSRCCSSVHSIPQVMIVKAHGNYSIIFNWHQNGACAQCLQFFHGFPEQRFATDYVHRHTLLIARQWQNGRALGTAAGRPLRPDVRVGACIMMYLDSRLNHTPAEYGSAVCRSAAAWRQPFRRHAGSGTL